MAPKRKQPTFRVVMSGDPTVWAHRDAPEYWERDEDGDYVLDELELRIPRRVEKPASGRITVAADSADEAVQIVRDQHPEYHTVESVEQLKG